MNCMRCGKTTTGTDVFCADCLAEMERYPVKPGTVIHIPTRKAAEPRRSRRKKEPSIEGQLARMRQLVSFMTATIIGLFTALILTGGMLLYVMTQPEEEPPAPVNRNYSTSAPTEGD